MIQELAGTVQATLARLATNTLDPRDEKMFCDHAWVPGTGGVWELQGRFLDAGDAFHFRHVGDYAGVEHLVAAIVTNTGTPAYQAAWRTFVPMLDEWLRIGRRNPWIAEAWDPPFNDRAFALCRSPEQMARTVDRDNWSLGTAFVLADTDVCMIQQRDGAGEFLMIRGSQAFDSWTTGPGAIHGTQLAAYLRAVVDAPVDADGHPSWYDRVRGCAPGGEPAVVPAETGPDVTRLLTS